MEATITTFGGFGRVRAARPSAFAGLGVLPLQPEVTQPGRVDPVVSPDYVTAGSRVKWTAVTSIGGFVTYDTIISQLEKAIADDGGYYDITAGGYRVYKITGVKLALTVEVSSRMDRGSINHLQQHFESLAQQLGLGISDSEIRFVHRAAPGTTPQPATTPSGVPKLGSPLDDLTRDKDDKDKTTNTILLVGGVFLAVVAAKQILS